MQNQVVSNALTRPEARVLCHALAGRHGHGRAIDVGRPRFIGCTLGTAAYQHNRRVLRRSRAPCGERCIVSVLLLRLEGPLQAWSSQGKLGVRDTEREPTKSGVLGLIGAAMGMARDDDAQLAELAALRMAVRVDRAGTLLHDYHTAGGGTFRGKAYTVFDTKACVPTHRYYLQNASFVVAVEGYTTTLARAADALRSPRFPLFLGRKSCPPSVPVLIGIVESDMRLGLTVTPLADQPDAAPYRIVLEADGGEGDVRDDVPLSFAAEERRYGRRYVITDWIADAPAAATEALA